MQQEWDLLTKDLEFKNETITSSVFISRLNHKQAGGAPFSSKLGCGLDFWLVAFVCQRCWIRLAANRILNLDLKSSWSLRPLVK